VKLRKVSILENGPSGIIFSSACKFLSEMEISFPGARWNRHFEGCGHSFLLSGRPPSGQNVMRGRQRPPVTACHRDVTEHFTSSPAGRGFAAGPLYSMPNLRDNSRLIPSHFRISATAGAVHPGQTEACHHRRIRRPAGIELL
jgi:hypothetical protein